MNGILAFKKGFAFQAANCLVNMLLISSMLLALFGLGWEYSTRLYLSGFSNAVLPFSSSPEQKITAILAWMKQGPARSNDYYGDDGQDRDPVDTLNYKELLNVCGTATNAFVNLASAGGLEARRLLLLDERGMNTNHVVAEVRLNGRWVIVDPSFHAMLRSKDGLPLTRQELARPEVLHEATRNFPGYDPGYNYEHPAFIHFARLPIVGGFLQSEMNSILPKFQEHINWTVLVERQSYDTMLVGIVLLCIGIFLRRLIIWYGGTISAFPMGPWEQLSHAGVALFCAFPEGKAETDFSGN